MSVDLWSKALEYISRNMTKSAFETWIKPLKPVKESEDQIVLEVSSSFQKEYIESHYSDSLKQILKTLTDKEISVLFKVNKNQIQHNQKETIIKLKPDISRPFLERYTFDSFITGDSNRVAYTAALNVARHPGKSYNPLFIYGKRGLGKTHLIQAIGNYIISEQKPVIVRYASAEEFGNDISQAVIKKDFDDFLKKYRQNDILLIDDINLLEGKEGFQNFFLHTFNALYMGGKQIVMTSDRPPRELKSVQPRLINRFEQGLIAEIQSPDFATRQAILRYLCQKAGIPVFSSIIQYIASKITDDIRRLEGAINRLLIEYRLTGTTPTVEKTEQILSAYFNFESEKDISIDDILSKTASFFKIKVENITGKRKTEGLVLARQIVMYIALEKAKANVMEIARRLQRSHTAVIHGYKKISKLYKEDLNVRNSIDSIISDLNEGF